MELRSCLISNQKLIRTSEEVFIFAEKIASECNLLTSDLILAAVWHCLNQTKETISSTGNNKTCAGNIESSNTTQHQNENRTGKELAGDSVGNTSVNSTEKAVGETKMDLHTHKPNDDNIKQKQRGRIVDAENAKEVWLAGESKSNTDAINKQQNSQSRNHSDTVSGHQLNTTTMEETGCQNNSKEHTNNLKESKDVCEIANIPVVSSSEPKSKLLNLLDKNIKMHSKTKETNEQGNISLDKNVNNFSVLQDKNKIDGQGPSVQEQIISTPVASVKDSQSSEKEGEGKTEKESIADVEIISIDDEDSNDVPGEVEVASITEVETVANDVNEETPEEKEPDYFDMDCDEIDDDNDGDEYEEMLDASTYETDKTARFEESSVNTNTVYKEADVTIISDDEEDCEVKNTDLKASTSSSKGESMNKTGNKSSADKSQLNTTSSKKQVVSEGTRRKQSLTNVMKDFTESVEEKTKGKSLMDSSDEKDSTRFTCPVMEHLDSMSQPKDGLSSEHGGGSNSSVPPVSDNDTSSIPAVAVLGLIPVGDIQKSVDNAVSTTEESSSMQRFPTLASNRSIYVSSGMMHGSIPSLPPVQDLHHVANIPESGFAGVYHSSDPVTCPSQSLSSTPGIFQFDEPGVQAQTSHYSQGQSSSVQSPEDEFGSPPRKKRLLDYDKKWHMEPKFSPEQDKDDELVKAQDGTLVRIKTEHEDLDLDEMPVDIENKTVFGSCGETEVNKHSRALVNTAKETSLNMGCVTPVNSEGDIPIDKTYDMVMNANNENSSDVMIKVEVPVNTDDETSDSTDKEMTRNSETGRIRQSYSPLIKLQFIERLKNGESQVSIHRDTGIPASTLRTWLKLEKQIRERVNVNSRVKGRHECKKRETRVEKKRENYTIYEKLQTIARVNNGESRAKVCRDLDLAESTLRGWLKDESKLKEEIFEFGCHSRQKNKCLKCKYFSRFRRRHFLDRNQMYLALPGGVEGNSVLADWRQPGNYTSVSQFPSVPSIGIEKVDSDYMNYHSMNDASFLGNDGDYYDDDYVDGDYHVDGDDDDGDSSDADDGNSNKSKEGSVRGKRGRGRPRGRGTRGTGRGVTKQSEHSGVRGRGRGSVRGSRGRPRGRPVLRCSRGRGIKSRGASVKIKMENRDVSPSKFSALRRGSRGRKIGFYSLKLGKPKHTIDSGAKEVVKRGRGRPVKRALHNNMIRTRSSVDRDDSGASSSTGQPSKRGIQSLRSGRGKSRGRKRTREQSPDKKQQEDVIIID